MFRMIIVSLTYYNICGLALSWVKKIVCEKNKLVSSIST